MFGKLKCEKIILMFGLYFDIRKFGLTKEFNPLKSRKINLIKVGEILLLGK